MAVVGGFNPLTTPWLATVVLLLAYIGLGTLALKRGKPRNNGRLPLCWPWRRWRRLCMWL